MIQYSCHMILQSHKLTVAKTVFCLLHSDTLGYSQNGACTKAVNVPTSVACCMWNWEMLWHITYTVHNIWFEAKYEFLLNQEVKTSVVYSSNLVVWWHNTSQSGALAPALSTHFKGLTLNLTQKHIHSRHYIFKTHHLHILKPSFVIDQSVISHIVETFTVAITGDWCSNTYC
jgi:hypothetical protein